MKPADHGARDRIRDDTGSTLFVDAGAGSGKTTALVDRVKTMVLRDGIRLHAIAAVTFTEKAGAELRDRLRGEFERARRVDGADRATIDAALDDLDSSAIGTLHSFAQRILAEHPIEAGLPPIIEVLDEVGSSVAFEGRWSHLQAALLDDDDIGEPLLFGLAAGMSLKHVRSLALLLGNDWDLIEERVLSEKAPAVRVPDLTGFATDVRAFLRMRVHCTADDDNLLGKLDKLRDLSVALDAAGDPESRLAVVATIADVTFTRGKAGNWQVPVKGVRDAGKDLAERARTVVGEVLDQCLRQVAQWIAVRVLDEAQTRRRAGKLEFHDLLVLARDLLRRDADVRAALHEQYQRLLLDEFQDTDPIQIELAVRICGGAAADAPDWRDVAVPDGRLFVVGDAKQSIYRFRRASIATYLQAQAHIGEPVGLTTNFRTVQPVLDWINAVFGSLIAYEPGGQPPYVPLGGHRQDVGSGPAVTVLGETAHTGLPKAAAGILRGREADDVAGTIRQALDEGWGVRDDRTGSWRPCRLEDIAVLVPARTSLPFLSDALDDAQIPYRAEASSLVYQAPEVRSLLACARAIADTSDSLSLVTALRSPLFGCGDDDLWNWKDAGGRFTLFSRLDDSPLSAGPVGSGLAYLKRLYADSRWMTPSEVLASIVAGRRALEIAAAGPRARDAWRRLRFVVDQARAWSEVSHGGLRAYLAWAAHQGEDAARVAESVLPERDSAAVRVMTVHAAKGLEFPIVIMSGMTAQSRVTSGVSLLWPASGGYEARLTKKVQTGDFEAAVPVDEQMDELEKRRLLYVAATRARDHLVVSLHRSDTSPAKTAARLIADAGGADGAATFTGYAAATVDPLGLEPVAPPPPFEAWQVGVDVARRLSRNIPAITASGLEGTEPAVVFAAGDGLAKGPRDLDLPPWSKGRYGSAIGRAVHAVLQTIDLRSGAGLAAAVSAQAVAEGVAGQEALVTALVESALASDVVRQACACEMWRETYVGTLREDGTLLEGYVDLVYRTPDGVLAIVDYKTDAVPAGAIGSRVTYYAPQMAAYREALGAATSAPVSATLLFLNPEGSVAVPVLA